MTPLIWIYVTKYGDDTNLNVNRKQTILFNTVQSILHTPKPGTNELVTPQLAPPPEITKFLCRPLEVLLLGGSKVM